MYRNPSRGTIILKSTASHLFIDEIYSHWVLLRIEIVEGEKFKPTIKSKFGDAGNI
jgi:hypothetical protein